MTSKFQIQVAFDFDQADLQTLLSALNGALSLLLQKFLSEYTEAYAVDFDCFMKWEVNTIIFFHADSVYHRADKGIHLCL